MNKVIISLLTLIIFSSCEKKITIDPENSEEKVAVEAIFSDNPFLSYVKLSKTKSIYEGILDHPKITDAVITLTDQTTGDIYDFIYVPSQAKYMCTAAGIPGHTYHLKIIADNQTITATQTMTEKIDLLRVISVPVEDNPEKYFLKMQFDDPPEHEDYYLFLIQPQDLSSGLESRFSVLTDLTYNRSERTLTISDEFFNKDENWNVLFFHIDRKNYNYLKVLHRAMKSLVNGTHPFYGLSMGNPVSTVEGNQTIGYFIASPVSFSPIKIGN